MLRNITLTNFRNLDQLELELPTGITILHGPNGIGKTNILESIYVGATTKSFRAPDKELILHGQDFFIFKAESNQGKESKQNQVELRVQRGQTTPRAQKQLIINSVKQPLRRVLGLNPVVLFAPSDLNLFSGPSAARRAVLDTILSQTNQEYARQLSLYKKLLQQRNALLRHNKINPIPHSDLEDQLFVFDLQINPVASMVSAQRAKLVLDIEPVIKKHYNHIAGTDTELEIVFTPSAAPENITNALLEARSADISSGHSTVGPHRDELLASLRDRLLAASASQGESRSFVLALKLAEFDYVTSQLGQQPLLLLDDVFSELDEGRRAHLIDTIKTGQVIITTTEVEKSLARNAQTIAVADLKTKKRQSKVAKKV